MKTSRQNKTKMSRTLDRSLLHLPVCICLIVMSEGAKNMIK